MKTYMLTAAVLLTILAQTLVTAGDAQDKKKVGPAEKPAPTKKMAPTASDAAQDFVFLAEARPLLVRVHVHVNGQPLQAAWNDFMAHWFRQIDVNNDGTLSQAELDRAPTIDHILAGGPSNLYGYGGGPRNTTGSLTVAEFDTNKDGKVDLAEFSAHFAKSRFPPFQMDVEPERDLEAILYMGPGKFEPPFDAVSDAAFALLDANKDGKITREELAAAPEVFRKLDTNEDEVLTTREIVPNARPMSRNGMRMMMGAGGGKSLPDLGNTMIVRIKAPGEAPADLAVQMHVRYSSKTKQSASGTKLGEMIDLGLKSVGLAKEETAADKAKGVSLSRGDLGLDPATFAALDTNGDGKLDAKELAWFVKRTPDVELVIRLGTRDAAEDRVQVLAEKGKTTSLAGSIKTQPDMAFVDLGTTRAEFRGNDGSNAKSDRISGLVRQQNMQLFKQSDMQGKGYLEEKDVEAYFGKASFKAMDRNGDGKVTEQEFTAYLDILADLQKRANQACVSLLLSNESRGLFDLLDVNRDGKLGIREVRDAVKLLERPGLAGKGYLTRADVPRSYRLTVRRGPATNGNNNSRFFAVYGMDEEPEEEAPAAGPAWFRKMDRNRDGDVSRAEWLGSDELFRRIDADGDGLISIQEAERYDAEQRLRK